MLDRKEQIAGLIQSKIISEKSALINEGGQRVWVLKVRTSATKLQVAEAVQTLFGEKVVAVNLLRVQGKRKQVRRRWIQRKDWKKAYVTLENSNNSLQPVTPSHPSESEGVEQCQ